jgi:serine/threonine protein kinase
MAEPQDFGQLKTIDWKLLQALADHFQEAWQTGHAADLQKFLPPPENPLRPLVLRELIIIDLEMRWRHAQVVCLEYYLERFPELAAAKSFWVQLLSEEYRIRHRHGDKPALSSYRMRFPEQFEELQRLLENVEAASATPSVTQTPTAAQPPEANGVEPAHQLSMAGNYKLLHRIGSGSFGEVWRAEAPGGFPAAVKVVFRPIDHEEAQRELAALEVIRGLRHPYLVQTQAYWSMKDRLYIVMELADASLRGRQEVCRKAGLHGIPPAELLRYFREAAEGLDYLHSQHVLHRDIKPENILLLQAHAKLADFGLARLHSSSRVATATGAGTPLYMAPEVYKGKIALSSDQYSLAMTYAELRLDRRLLQGSNLVELMWAALQQEPDLAPLREAEQRVIRRALNKDHQQRYPSCLEWVRDLEAALAEELAPPAPKSVSKSRLKVPAPDPETAEGDTGAATRAAPPVPRRRSFLILVLMAVGSGFAGGLGLYLAAKYRDHLFAITTSPETNPVTISPTTKGDSGSGVPSTPSVRDTRPVPTRREEPVSSPRVTVEEKPVWPLHRGRAAIIPVVIHRDRFSGPITLTPSFTYGPEGDVHGPPVTLPAGGPDTEEVKLTVQVDKDAKLGTERGLAIKPSSGERQFTPVTLRLAVVFLPGGDAQGSDLTQDDDKWFYNEITWRSPGGMPIEFRLIPYTRDSDLRPFYIMVDKVSVGQFGEFADSPQFKNQVGSGWNSGSPPNHPALGLTWKEASLFAEQWVGGKIPSTAQWDKAAGFNAWDGKDEQVGPFRGKWTGPHALDIAVGKLKTARPLRDAKQDESKFHCRDMAGNGNEWTSTKVDPLDPDVMALRGMGFRSPDPLLFKDLLPSSNAIGSANRKEELKRYDDLGLRVVIEAN